MCKFGKVSRCGYYKWLQHANDPDKDYEDYLKIKNIFDQGKGKYGWRNIKMRIPGMNHKKIQRIMKKYGLATKVRKRNPYKQMFKKNLAHRTFPNQLQRQFKQTVPFKFLCTDITYIPFQDKFTYLSVVKDIASGEVVAWNLSLHPNMALVTGTIKKISFKPNTNTLIHSDQGFHYTNLSYINILKKHNMTQSMSAKGKCIDNAPIESFFGHLKDELDYRLCQTYDELRCKIDEYMAYYNNERKQWSRKRMAPIEYRKHLLALVG